MAAHRYDKSAGGAARGPAGTPPVPGEGEGGSAGGGEPRPASERGAEEVRYGSKAPEFVRRSRALRMTWRIGVAVVGAAVIAGGVLLLPLPGPGWAIIFAGLAILSSEFAWAQRLLHWVKVKVTEYARRAVDPRVRRRNLVVLVVVLLVLAGCVELYVWKRGWTLPW